MRERLRADRIIAAVLAVACAVLALARPGAAAAGQLAPVTAALTFAAGGWLPRWPGFAGVIALSVAIQADMGTENLPNFEIGLVTILPWAAGLVFRDRRDLVAGLRARRAELERAEDEYVRLAVRRERAAIARELHDIVSHNLAVIAVQAGAGRMATADPPQTRAERFRAIRRAGEQALTEMALLVDLLGAERAGGFGDLPALLARAAAGGVEVTMAPLPAAALPERTEAAAVAVIHEALTNAMKHAPGSVGHISVRDVDGEVRVEVRDDGAAGPAPLAGSGSGIGVAGMRERVAAMGGTLAAGPHGDGWRVLAVLPAVPGSPRGRTADAPPGGTPPEAATG
ncbi:MAG: histidine kinase [Thermoleophilia bacterium]